MIVCVAAGAVVNIGVAWGCALWFRPDSTKAFELSQQRASALWLRYAPSNWSAEFPPIAMRQESRGVRIDVATNADPELDVSAEASGLGTVIEYRFGWPLHSLRCIGVARLWASDPMRLNGAWRVEREFMGIKPGQLVPFQPIFWGFVANTVFFAAIVWLLIRGPSETRRRWRQLQGQCQRCGGELDARGACAKCAAANTRG